MTTRGFVLTVLAVVLCACATPQQPVQEAGLQNAVYVVGDNGPLHALPAVEKKDTTAETGSALKRLYLFFVRR